jgi:hypothetical protein
MVAQFIIGFVQVRMMVRFARNRGYHTTTTLRETPLFQMTCRTR